MCRPLAEGKLSMDRELQLLQEIIGLQRGVTLACTLDLLVVPGCGPFFFAGARRNLANAYVHAPSGGGGGGGGARGDRFSHQPSAAELAETALVGADAVQRLGLRQGCSIGNCLHTTRTCTRSLLPYYRRVVIQVATLQATLRILLVAEYLRTS